MKHSHNLEIFWTHPVYEKNRAVVVVVVVVVVAVAAVAVVAVVVVVVVVVLVVVVVAVPPFIFFLIVDGYLKRLVPNQPLPDLIRYRQRPGTVN